MSKDGSYGDRSPYEMDYSSDEDSGMNLNATTETEISTSKRTRSTTLDGYVYPKKTSKIIISPPPSPTPIKYQYQNLPPVKDTVLAPSHSFHLPNHQPIETTSNTRLYLLLYGPPRQN